MNKKIIDKWHQLLDITTKKLDLLRSVAEHPDHIKTNEILAREFQEMYLELFDQETNLIIEKEIMIECPGCGFECGQIHTYCVACGLRLPGEYNKSGI